MADMQSLKRWVAQQLDSNAEQIEWQPLAGDAGFRRYVRCIRQGQPYMAAIAPPATEKNEAFVQIAELLNQAGVAAPKVLAVDYQQGFLLQTDLGDTPLQKVLNEESVDGYYQQAMQLIAKMQTISSDAIASYDSAALAVELSYFKTWFLEAMLDYACSAQEENMLDAFFAVLLDSAGSQPQAFVHRDFHYRNIMRLENDTLACIDFRDALIGPITYDLASLLRDCYVVWPDEKVYAWLELYRQQHWPEIAQQQFKDYFDFMGLQRHIKVLGVFARLSLRDNKHGYLNDSPTVFNYVLQVAEQQPQAQAQAFATWLRQSILPLAQQQSWGKDL